MTPDQVEMTALEMFMQNLLRAGFDVQAVLAKGYDYAMHERFVMHSCDQMLSSSQSVADAAEKLDISQRSQNRAYRTMRAEIRSQIGVPRV